MTYEFSVDDRYYQEWKVRDTATLQIIEKNIDPLTAKLFNGDEFSIGKTCMVHHSKVRQMSYIPGVLVLENNKTYGRWKRDKFLYQCIPDDRQLPIFLIPYKVKVEFTKKAVNKYITFVYKNWDYKHPYGTIHRVVGNVNNLNCFYEYQLYCKNLYVPIKIFNRVTAAALRKKRDMYYIQSISNKYKVEDRCAWDVYSIDPPGSKDFDDAWSIKREKESILLSIYIANVTLWLEVMNLWEYFSERVSTIYLPDRKRAMLPTVLSDKLCSLQENNQRIAFTLDVLFDLKTGEIQRTTFLNTKISLTRNCCYGDIGGCIEYPLLLKNIRLLNRRYPYQTEITDSHDVIGYMMILMNDLSGRKLMEFKSGIFRSVRVTDAASLNVPREILGFMKSWNSSGGKYVTHLDYHAHDILQLKAYTHITSPIRRLPDILNILVLQDKLKLVPMSMAMKAFYDRWILRLHYINQTMRSIRKVQNDCALLHYCYIANNNEVEGIIFEKSIRNKELFQYMVYFPSIKMVNYFKTEDNYKIFSKHSFRIFIFMDEDRLKQKVRIDILEQKK